MNKTEALALEAKIYEMCKEAIEAIPDGLEIANVAGYKEHATVFLKEYGTVEAATYAVRCLEDDGWYRDREYVSQSMMAMVFEHGSNPHITAVYCSDLDGSIEAFIPGCKVVEDHKLEKGQRIVCAYE